MEKFIKHFYTLGSHILEKSSEFNSTISMINSETDLRIFIDENKSEMKFPFKIEYKPYEHSEEVKKQKTILIS